MTSYWRENINCTGNFKAITVTVEFINVSMFVDSPSSSFPFRNYCQSTWNRLPSYCYLNLRRTCAEYFVVKMRLKGSSWKNDAQITVCLIFVEFGWVTMKIQDHKLATKMIKRAKKWKFSIPNNINMRTWLLRNLVKGELKALWELGEL